MHEICMLASQVQFVRQGYCTQPCICIQFEFLDLVCLILGFDQALHPKEYWWIILLMGQLQGYQLPD